MDSFLGAEMKRIEKILEGFEQKMVKSEKSKHDKALKSMDFVFDRLFPKGGLQERSMNFFQLCADGNVSNHVQEMKEAIDPFEKDFCLWFR